MRLLSRIPLYPVLLAAYAVLFLYASNLALVLPVDAAAPLARAVGAALLAWAVLALLLRDVRRGAIVAAALVVAFYAFGHVGPGLTGFGLDDRVQLAVWGALIVAALVYAVRARGSLPTVTAGLNVLAIVLVAMTAVSIVPYELGRAGRTTTGLAPAVLAQPASRTDRDIWFLVFDRYGSEEALERRFGITDNDLYDWLRGEGFQVPEHSHANYRATDFSLAATLNMRYLDELTRTIGRTADDRTPAQAMLKDHAVGQFLKAQGYRYYQLASWYGPTRSITSADEMLILGETSEFESVLNDTTVMPAVDRVLGNETPELTFLDRHREGTLFELRQLHRLATAPGPKFVFAHILLPHDPYVFHADGSPMSEAEAQAEDDETVLYRGHLTFVNEQIRSIVRTLLSVPEDQRPIVILQGDEGPLACRSVDCVGTSADYLRIRLGNLMAMYLPGVDVQLPETFSSVNTFRTVFREYFGADLPALPDRSYTWPDNDHIYDFRDVTELVVDPGP
jgi:hypothetical protein